MKTVDVQLVKAFTKNKDEGNPAGVVLDAENLTPEEMLQIAVELGYSESAFVLPSEKADVRIRYFAPKHEVNLCGHATIAAVQALQESQRITSGSTIKVETKAGMIEVEHHEDGKITMTQAKPEFLNYEPDRREIANVLGLQKDDLTGWPLKIVSTGTPKLLIPIDTFDALMAIKVDRDKVMLICKESGARGIYPFTTDMQTDEGDFHARQFNPLAGIEEDPVCGVAAGALGAYIRHFDLMSKRHFVVENGYSMNTPGLVYVDATNKIKVGGYAVTFGETTVDV